MGEGKESAGGRDGRIKGGRSVEGIREASGDEKYCYFDFRNIFMSGNKLVGTSN
jgi:hypothetical protein